MTVAVEASRTATGMVIVWSRMWWVVTWTKLPSGVDRLVLLVGGNGVGAEFTADAAGLDAAEGRPGVGQIAVDADGAGPHPPGDVLAVLGVGGPHRAAEAVVGVVGYPDGVFFVAVGDDGQHGSEDFFLRDRGGVVDVGEHSWLDEPAAVQVPGASAACDQAGAVAGSLSDIPFNAVAVPVGGHGPDLGGWVEGVAHGQRGREGRERVDDLVVA